MTINTDFLFNKVPDLSGSKFTYHTRFDITEDGQPGLVLELRLGDDKLFETGFELFFLPLIHAYCNDELDELNEYAVPSLDQTHTEYYTGAETIKDLDESFGNFSETVKSIASILRSTGVVDVAPAPAQGPPVNPKDYDSVAMEAIRARMTRTNHH